LEEALSHGSIMTLFVKYLIVTELCMDNTLNSMVVMTENDKTINPKILDLLPLDLTTQLSSYPETSNTSINKNSSITSSNETDSS